MIRATLDTNVIVSGLKFEGHPRRIFDMAESGMIRMAVSVPILEEVCDVLQRDKFGFSKGEANAFVDALKSIALHVTPENRVDVMKVDPDDNRILECAVASRSDYLVTGDKHLLNIGQFRQVEIVKPSDFVMVAQQYEI